MIRSKDPLRRGNEMLRHAQEAEVNRPPHRRPKKERAAVGHALSSFLPAFAGSEYDGLSCRISSQVATCLHLLDKGVRCADPGGCEGPMAVRKPGVLDPSFEQGLVESDDHIGLRPNRLHVDSCLVRYLESFLDGCIRQVKKRIHGSEWKSACLFHPPNRLHLLQGSLCDNPGIGDVHQVAQHFQLAFSEKNLVAKILEQLIESQEAIVMIAHRKDGPGIEQ